MCFLLAEASHRPGRGSALVHCSFQQGEKAQAGSALPLPQANFNSLILTSGCVYFTVKLFSLFCFLFVCFCLCLPIDSAQFNTCVLFTILAVIKTKKENKHLNSESLPEAIVHSKKKQWLSSERQENRKKVIFSVIYAVWQILMCNLRLKLIVENSPFLLREHIGVSFKCLYNVYSTI